MVTNIFYKAPKLHSDTSLAELAAKYNEANSKKNIRPFDFAPEFVDYAKVKGNELVDEYQNWYYGVGGIDAISKSQALTDQNNRRKNAINKYVDLAKNSANLYKNISNSKIDPLDIKRDNLPANIQNYNYFYNKSINEESDQRPNDYFFGEYGYNLNEKDWDNVLNATSGWKENYSKQYDAENNFIGVIDKSSGNFVDIKSAEEGTWGSIPVSYGDLVDDGKNIKIKSGTASYQRQIDTFNKYDITPYWDNSKGTYVFQNNVTGKLTNLEDLEYLHIGEENVDGNWIESPWINDEVAQNKKVLVKGIRNEQMMRGINSLEDFNKYSWKAAKLIEDMFEINTLQLETGGEYTPNAIQDFTKESVLKILNLDNVLKNANFDMSLLDKAIQNNSNLITDNLGEPIFQGDKIIGFTDAANGEKSVKQRLFEGVKETFISQPKNSYNRNKTNANKDIYTINSGYEDLNYSLEVDANDNYTGRAKQSESVYVQNSVDIYRKTAESKRFTTFKGDIDNAKESPWLLKYPQEYGNDNNLEGRLADLQTGRYVELWIDVKTGKRATVTQIRENKDELILLPYFEATATFQSKTAPGVSPFKYATIEGDTAPGLTWGSGGDQSFTVFVPFHVFETASNKDKMRNFKIEALSTIEQRQDEYDEKRENNNPKPKYKNVPPGGF
jgi:hypothetical protein